MIKESFMSIKNEFYVKIAKNARVCLAFLRSVLTTGNISATIRLRGRGCRGYCVKIVKKMVIL